MKKKLVKVGGSRALVIDNAILKLLGIKKGDEPELILEVEGGSLIVTPVIEITAKVSDREDVQRSYERVKKKYTPALRKIAKH